MLELGWVENESATWFSTLRLYLYNTHEATYGVIASREFSILYHGISFPAQSQTLPLCSSFRFATTSMSFSAAYSGSNNLSPGTPFQNPLLKSVLTGYDIQSPQTTRTYKNHFTCSRMYTHTYAGSLLVLQLQIKCLDDLIEGCFRASVRVPPSSRIIRNGPYSSRDVHPFRHGLRFVFSGW